LLEA
jgi:hypothetical protein